MVCAFGYRGSIIVGGNFNHFKPINVLKYLGTSKKPYKHQGTVKGG